MQNTVPGNDHHVQHAKMHKQGRNAKPYSLNPSSMTFELLIPCHDAMQNTVPGNDHHVQHAKMHKQVGNTKPCEDLVFPVSLLCVCPDRVGSGRLILLLYCTVLRCILRLRVC